MTRTILILDEGQPSAIRAARRFNLEEYLQFLAPTEALEFRDRPEAMDVVRRAVLITHRDTVPPTVPDEKRPKDGYVEVPLDWSDIDECPTTNAARAGDPAALSCPGTRDELESLKELFINADEQADSSVAAAPSERPSRLPKVIAAGDSLRAVWAESGTLESQVVRAWDQIRASESDPSTHVVVAADGRLAVIVQDRRVSAFVIVTASNGVKMLPMWTDAVGLPEDLGSNPRLISAGTTLLGETRLTVATDSDTWRVFVAVDGSVQGEPFGTPKRGDVTIGFELLSDVTAYRASGLPAYQGAGEGLFAGLSIRAVDASSSGGVRVVAAVGTDPKGKTALVVRRRAANQREWESLDLSSDLPAVDNRGEPSVDVTIERRIDGQEPQYLIIAIGSKQRVVPLPTRVAATVSGSGEIEA